MSHSWPRFLSVVPTPLSPSVGRCHVTLGCIFILFQSVRVRFVVLMYMVLIVAVWSMSQKRWGTWGVACSETVRNVSSGRTGLLCIMTDRPTNRSQGWICQREVPAIPSPSVARVMSVVAFLQYNQRDALFLKFIFGIGLYMFRTVSLSIIRSLVLYTQQ
jgi:hypothetical protein